MGNIQQFITFITLLNLGCVLSQKVTWINNQGKNIIVTEGNTPVEIECFYRVPTDTGNYDYLPHLVKIQDINYVENQVERSEEIDTSMGFEVAAVSSVKGDYAGRLEADFDNWKDGGSQLDNGQRKLVVKVLSPELSDSAKYVCHIEHSGEVYQQVHMLTVLPRNKDNLLEITLSGMADATDNDTRFGDTGAMNYYSNEESGSPRGVLECKVCDGASEPLIKIMIGEDDVTDNIMEVEESDDVTLVGEDDGEETRQIRRCFTRRHSAYRLTPQHNGQMITCSAKIEDGDGEEYYSAEKTRMITVYGKAQKVDGSCAREQFSPLNTRGQMRCSFMANPAASSVVWVNSDTSERYDTNAQDGFGWSATNEYSDTYTTSVLSFDEVTDDTYGDYYLEVENMAGKTEIYITFEQGEEIPWVRPSEQPGASERPSTGASAIHCALSLILASLLLTMKLMTS